MILDGRTLIEVLPLADMYTVYVEHRRLKVFVHKGCECVVCGRVGKLLLVTVDKGGKRHVDLYTEDLVLMTVDHMVPKAEARRIGWSKQAIERLANKQPMCSPDNCWKSDKPLTPEQIRQIRGVAQLKPLKGATSAQLLLRSERLFGLQLTYA